jgi:WD40 repeat protein
LEPDKESRGDEVLDCKFSSDGRYIISASKSGFIKVWDFATATAAAAASESVKPIATFFDSGEMLGCDMYGSQIIAGGSQGLYFLELVQ